MSPLSEEARALLQEAYRSNGPSKPALEAIIQESKASDRERAYIKPVKKAAPKYSLAKKGLKRPRKYKISARQKLIAESFGGRRDESPSSQFKDEEEDGK